DCRLLAWLRSHKRRLLKRIANRAIAPQPLLEHTGEQWDLTVDVIVDAHLALPRVQPVKAPSVLDERALPRDGHGQKEGVLSRVVEHLADVAYRCENVALLVARDVRLQC